MSDIEVMHERGDRFTVRIRGHELEVDQPIEDGGEDSAPTPVELFGASLAACVAYYARRFLARHGLNDGELRVDCDMGFADDPWRVGNLDVRVALPVELDAAKQKALQRVVEHCTVHASLQRPPEIRIELGVPVP